MPGIAAMTPFKWIAYRINADGISSTFHCKLANSELLLWRNGESVVKGNGYERSGTVITIRDTPDSGDMLSFEEQVPAGYSL